MAFGRERLPDFTDLQSHRRQCLAGASPANDKTDYAAPSISDLLAHWCQALMRTDAITEPRFSG